MISKIQKYYDDLALIMSSIDHAEIERAVLTLKECVDRGSTIFIAGNGGSATTASHMANDLIRNISLAKRSGVSVISLVDNLAMLTALSNDHSYVDVFEKQLKIMMRPGDLLIAFSASGNSENIISACNFSKEMSNKIIGITGFDGGKLKNICDESIHVQSANGEYEKVEDVHLSITHILASMVCDHSK